MSVSPHVSSNVQVDQQIQGLESDLQVKIDTSDEEMCKEDAEERKAAMVKKPYLPSQEVIG